VYFGRLMNDLIKRIEILKKGEVGYLVNERIKEFKNINRNNNDEVFQEMCFCILTANFNAEKCINIQKKIGNCFLENSEIEIAKKLKKIGYRYPNKRAKYISDSFKYKDSMKDIIESYSGEELREWLVEHIKGFGYKEASHFLRNIGFDNYAIIDFHIVDILERNNLIKKPKSLSKKKYLEIEQILKNIAMRVNLSLSEIDLYLWFMETGKILK
jgi:N-glycosylase/DNA lyase